MDIEKLSSVDLDIQFHDESTLHIKVKYKKKITDKDVSDLKNYFADYFSSKHKKIVLPENIMTNQIVGDESKEEAVFIVRNNQGIPPTAIKLHERAPHVLPYIIIYLRSLESSSVVGYAIKCLEDIVFDHSYND